MALRSLPFPSLFFLEEVSLKTASQPDLYSSVETLEKLKNSFISHEGKHIIYPKHDGRQGNPVLFPQKYFDEIMFSTGDRGCKRVLRKYPDDAVPIPIDSNEVILDCDTNEDYLKLKYHSEELNVQT